MVVESEDAGFAKILTVRGSDKILGATIVAPHADDLLHEFVLTMNAKIGLGKIASMIHAYPILAEPARKDCTPSLPKATSATPSFQISAERGLMLSRGSAD